MASHLNHSPTGTVRQLHLGVVWPPPEAQLYPRTPPHPNTLTPTSTPSPPWAWAPVRNRSATSSAAVSLPDLVLTRIVGIGWKRVRLALAVLRDSSPGHFTDPGVTRGAGRGVRAG